MEMGGTMKFNITRLITALLPSAIMLIIALISFAELLDSLDAMGLFIIGLLLIYPLLFLGQGVACAFGKGNIFLSITVSSITFVIIVFVFLNSSALMYIVLYLIIAFFAYGITLFSQRIQNKAKHL